MVRALTRKITRRVGETDMVFTATDYGITFRRFRKQFVVRVSWETLFSQFCPDADPIMLFQNPPPARWLPAVGETVWARHETWMKPYRATVLRVLSGCGEEIIRVKRRGRSVEVLRSAIRPCFVGIAR